MAEEIKVRIRDRKAAERRITSKGGRFTGEISVRDSYFNQPAGETLKVTEDDRGNFVVRLHTSNGKFQITEYRRIRDAEKMKRKFGKLYGLKCVLHKKRRFFSLGKLKININVTRELGSFLIVEGENLNKPAVMKALGIQHPDYVTLAFDELYARKNKARK
ncbi:hypothetical protein HYS54_03150 [Candidatus Micrarchaeota archaeon]|nr:hypothetical protein [Candidatus Micrarchaeota archaeon]